MVDLVKIRKKAKGGRGSVTASQEPAPADVTPPLKPESATAATVPDTRAEARPPAASSPGLDKLERFKQIAGKRREGFIEQDAEISSVNQVELLTFVIAGEQYAVSIDHIVEIVTPRVATQVPNADPTIVGIISLRGTIVTVIDVRRKLRHPSGNAGKDTRIIVVERGAETLGFEVDHVLRVLKVDSAAIEPPPVVHSSELSEAVRGVFRQGNALTILIDLDKLLA